MQKTVPVAVQTFECIGLYWSSAEGSIDNECLVKYRVSGNSAWEKAMPLWFDVRNKEYRGSIVGLTPDTTYEIMLELATIDNSVTLTSKTWCEEFPIAKTIFLTEMSNSTLKIDQSGTHNGYILYTSPEGKISTIDVNNNEDVCVDILPNVSYIIIRGLILSSAEKHAVKLGKGVNNIVIEECDISNWGTVKSDGWGEDYHSAVFAGKETSVERIIIQRNKIHHPRSDANSWYEYRSYEEKGTFHPMGPQAVTLFNSKGNHVIRYNEVFSDEDHYFNDGYGGGDNYSFLGFPNRDSDIYGNYISNCWDDGIESEGANCNVRIWKNYIDKTFVKIAIACTSNGPLYIWRNIANTSRKDAVEHDSDKYGRGTFIKAGGRTVDGTWFGGGRTYVFHNTVLQQSPPQGQKYPLGCGNGIQASGGKLYELVTRNNIFTNFKNWHTTFIDKTNSCSNDFDYDLYVGKLHNDCSIRQHQGNGIKLYRNNLVIFDPENKQGEYALKAGTPGSNAGTIIHNINDNYNGDGPDIGAFEAYSPAMEFGMNAYK